MASYGKNYKDRGMVKWAGFYLSEHTDTLHNEKTAEANRPVQKMQMDVDEIGEILSEAVLKSRKIVIQIEERDSNGYYRPDIIGMIQGSDELGIYVGGTKVGYDEIRNVAFSNELKWSDMERFKI